MKVLITGANRGLGDFLSDKFIKEGHEVLRHEGSAHYNLSDPEQVAKLAGEALYFGATVLVNNAAIICPDKIFLDYTDQEIWNMVNVNLTAPILLSYQLQEQLTDIVNINSMVGLEIKSPRTLYSATKWGLRGFAESLKKENKDINILDVYPTNIKTTPDRENAMDVSFVVDSIYNSFINKEKQLILDGRKN